VPDQSTAVVILNESEARQLTEEIKLQLSIHAKSGEKVLAQLRIVDEGEAWKALGYSSMARYITDEFGYSRSNAYNIIDQYQQVKRLSGDEVSSTGQLDGVSSTGHIPTQREAIRERQAETVRADAEAQLRGEPMRDKRRSRQGPRGLTGVLDSFERSMVTLNDAFESAGDDALSYLDADSRRAFERTITHLFEFSSEWAQRLSEPVTQREVDEWESA